MKQEIDNQTEIELARFFKVAAKLAAEGDSFCPMPDCSVDEYWHKLEASPQAYQKLSIENVGCEIDHLNDYARNPEYLGFGNVKWVPVYEAMFGRLGTPWFTDPRGNFSIGAYEEYLQKGKMIASWRCNPGIKLPTNKPSTVTTQQGTV